MNLVELTINGKTVKAEKGATILQAALKSGIYIPNLCYDRRLKPYGGCRMCVVEVEGQKGLSAACSTQIREGMTVHTETPGVAKSRKAVLELLLLHHPLDCPVCDKAGECKLQDLAYKYGSTSNRFSASRKNEPERLDSPVVERNPNRCILCGLCVRICQDHQGVGAINFIGRGFKTKISPAFEETLDCEFCGQCIDVCPVGALGSKTYRFMSRVWYMNEEEIVCPYCGCGCTTNLSIRQGRIIRGRGKEGIGINDGDLCGKGRYGFDYVYSENRLKTPLIRKDGNLVQASWDEALKYVAERMSGVIEKHGPAAVGAIGSQRCSIEDNFMLQKFMREAVGTDNIDSAARFGYAKAHKAMEAAFGSDFQPIGWEAPLNAKFLLVIESDITSAMPVWGLNFILAKNNGSYLAVADSKETKLVRNSSQWLRLVPGTGVALLNGMIKVIIDEGLYDKEKAQGIQNFDALENSLKDYTPSAVSVITGVSEDEIRNLARDYASAKSRLIAMTSGASENIKSLNTMLAGANLVMLLGDGPDSLQIPAEFSNTLGMWSAGVRPAGQGKEMQEMLYANDGSLKALYIMGENPLVTFHDVNTVEKTLKGMELLVVQDIFLTDTAKLADVVLPACSWAEKDGTFMSAAGNVQKIRKIVKETGESIPDWEILLRLSKAMGKDLGLNSLNEINAQVSEKLSAPGKKDLKLSFNPAPYELIENLNSEFPMLLVTANILQHSGALSSLSRNLDSVVSDAYLELSPADAEKYKIKNESYVKVISKRGEILLKAIVSNEVPEKTVFVPIHFAHAKVNTLTYPAVNGGIPLVPVRIEPA